MLARTTAARMLRHHSIPRRIPSTKPLVRRYSAASSPPVEAPVNVGSHPLAGVATQLDQIAPRFEIDSSQVEILDSPSSFYETLKVKIRSAKRRIYLSTLYIGKAEHEFVDTIKQALRDNPRLQVSILTDALRGTREDPQASCATLIAPLITEFGDRVKIAMFHTPNLNGWKKRYMPKRINEGWGLQHMKLYGFDDEIMLSGANLSDDYFTNRVDRYHLFASKELADYYAAIHDAVCEISYHVLPSEEAPGGFELISPHHRGLPDPVWHPRKFKAYAKQLLEPLIHRKARQKMFPTPFEKDKTFVYPLAQFDVLLGEPRARPLLDYEFASYTSTEKPALSRLLQAVSKDGNLRNSTWTFTAGYFNIDPDIRDSLIGAAPQTQHTSLTGGHTCTVITASPFANGFYGSKGISGMLPAAYTLLSRRFLREVDRVGKKDVIQLKEWRRGTVGQPEGWTYHAKGIWLTLPNSQAADNPSHEDAGPSITVVGSSNYTKRSYSLDLEVGAMILTDDDKLRRKLKAETEWLQQYATVTTQDDLAKIERRVGLRVRLSLWLVERLGGAL